MGDLMSTEMCIYKLTAKENGMAYVGQTTGALGDRVNGSHQIVQACGGIDKLEVSVLAQATSKEALTLLEVQYIFSEKTYAPHGLNRSIPACGSIIEKLLTDIGLVKKEADEAKNDAQAARLEVVQPSAISDEDLSNEVCRRVDKRELEFSDALYKAYPLRNMGFEISISPALHPEIILELYNWASKEGGNIDRIATDLIMIGYMVLAKFPTRSRVLFAEQEDKEKVKSRWY